MEVSEALCEQNIACEASAASGEWIRPFKPNKPREVAVCRVKRGAMFQRNCGDNSIHDKSATGLRPAPQAGEGFPMAPARIEDAGGGLGEPRGNHRLSLRCRERMLEYAGICADAQEDPQRQPGEANHLGPRENRFEPRTPRNVMLGSSMARGHQGRVDEEHR